MKFTVEEIEKALFPGFPPDFAGDEAGFPENQGNPCPASGYSTLNWKLFIMKVFFARNGVSHCLNEYHRKL